MQAAVTRGGALVVGEVADPTPGSGHVLVRSLAAGICGSDLHALADFARLHRADGLGRRPLPRSGGGLRLRPRVLRRDHRARTRHRPGAAGGHAGLLGAHRRDPDRRRADRLLQPLPGRPGRAHGAPGDAAPARPRLARHRPGRADRTAGRGRARRRALRARAGATVPGGGVRPGRPGRHRRPQGPGPRAGPGGRLLAHPPPPGRGLRGRRGHRPGRRVPPRPLGRLRRGHRGDGTGRRRPTRRPPSSTR